MERVLGAPVVFLGLSLPEHGYHAPNEFFDWPQVQGGIAAFAHFFSSVATLDRQASPPIETSAARPPAASPVCQSPSSFGLSATASPPNLTRPSPPSRHRRIGAMCSAQPAVPFRRRTPGLVPGVPRASAHPILALSSRVRRLTNQTLREVCPLHAPPLHPAPRARASSRLSLLW